MGLTKAAIKAAEDAVWTLFETNLATAKFSYRDEYNNEIAASAPIPCKPGETLTQKAPASSGQIIDAIWIVYCDSDGEEIMSFCLGQGRLNGYSAIADVPTRDKIFFGD